MQLTIYLCTLLTSYRKDILFLDVKMGVAEMGVVTRLKLASYYFSTLVQILRCSVLDAYQNFHSPIKTKLGQVDLYQLYTSYTWGGVMWQLALLRIWLEVSIFDIWTKKSDFKCQTLSPTRSRAGPEWSGPRLRIKDHRLKREGLATKHPRGAIRVSPRFSLVCTTIWLCMRCEVLALYWSIVIVYSTFMWKTGTELLLC